MLSADCAVFTPEHTLAGMLESKANLTSGPEYAQDLQGAAESGNYVIVADPERYSTDAMKLIHATSRQFARALPTAP